MGTEAVSTGQGRSSWGSSGLLLSKVVGKRRGPGADSRLPRCSDLVFHSIAASPHLLIPRFLLEANTTDLSS